MGAFQIKDGQFWLDDQPFRILSGAMHYFRIPPEYWDDRLYELRTLGLNTLETYIAWVNGFNLGRYWNTGPQRRLYLPAPLLRSGKNQIILLELHGSSDPAIELCDRPDLGEA